MPTLVIHRTGDECLKIEEGRYVAKHIPGAKLVELPGNDHLPFVGDQESILEEVEEFLTGVSHQPEPDTVLATILYMIRAACAISHYASRLDIKMRAGLHTGECEMTDGTVTGLATEVCLEVANHAKGHEVLVSSTVKDLVD